MKYRGGGQTQEGDFEIIYKAREKTDLTFELRGIRTGMAIMLLLFILIGIFKPEIICKIFCHE